MPDSLTLVWLSLLTLLLLVISTAAVWVFRRYQRRMIKELRSLKRDQLGLYRSSVGVGKSLQQVSGQAQILKQKCTVLENQSQLPCYDQAAEFIKLGANVDDLMTHCGFSKSEAELLISIIKSKQNNPVQYTPG